MTYDQAACLAAIRDLTVDGVAPTRDELRDHLGLASKSGVQRLIESLEDQGKIVRFGQLARGLCITAGPYERVTLEGLTSDQLGALRDNALAILAQRKAGGA